MKAKVNRTNISEHLVEYQLNMVGKTMLDVQWFDLQFGLRIKQEEL